VELNQRIVWKRSAHERMAALIVQLGIQSCGICGSEALVMGPSPVMLPVGGTAWDPPGTPLRGNVLFMALVRCETCGHALLFDSEKLMHGDEDVFWIGPGAEPETDTSPETA
jgi:hypothetical protein